MARDDDIVVASVYVNDDVAVEDSLYTVGRRGVAERSLCIKLLEQLPSEAWRSAKSRGLRKRRLRM